MGEPLTENTHFLGMGIILSKGMLIIDNHEACPWTILGNAVVGPRTLNTSEYQGYAKRE